MQITDQHASIASKLTRGTVAHQRHTTGIFRNEPVMVLMDTLLRYAEKHERRFESKLSEDYFLGPAWLQSIMGVRTLLNGEGDFDGGTLEELFWKALEVAGFTEADL
jgi:hypothetical protein